MPEDTQKIEVDKKTFDELAALPDVVKNLVEELKVERTAKQTAEAERDAAKVAIPPVQPAPDAKPEDAETVVRRILAEGQNAAAATAREKAEQRFKASHPEFSADNDAGGLKFAAFKSTLAKLNDSSAKSEEDFGALYDDALVLMNRPAPQEQVYTPYADTPSQSGAPRVSDQNGLSLKEKKIIQGLGWTEEKYLGLKKSRPNYVAQLIAATT